ncbi:MAG TPA: HAD-IA family hydrolase [Candidatus Paceibacterota bacterium]|nr:HAD-IA family hydrolase [Candidatus Paceibacterota bacterium]
MQKTKMKKTVIFDMYGVLVRRNFFINEEEDTEMVALVRELKERGTQLLLLSNIYIWNSAHFKRKYRFLELFDRLYFSSDTHFSKPDPAAFRMVLEENNLSSEDCVFFDDTKANVEGAKALGIEAYVFEGPDATRKALGM